MYPFFVPGTDGSQPATVSAFGAVFTDVDLLRRTSIQFFDTTNNLIDNQFVSLGTVPDQSLSFLGAIGDADEQIARVRITTGNSLDLVAMDDFIFAEPQGVPESGGIVLMVLGLGSLLFFYRPSLAVS